MKYNDFTVNELITDVLTDFLYLYGTDFENIRGRDMTRGIKLINEILSEDSIPLLGGSEGTVDTSSAILYGDALALDTFPATGSYLVSVEFVHWDNNDILIPLKRMTDGEYNSNGYNLSVRGAPQKYFFKREKDGKDEAVGQNNTISIYPLPDQEYKILVGGRYSQPILITQDNIQDKLYLTGKWLGYLRYALARKFKDYFPNAKWTQAMEAEYRRLYVITQTSSNRDTSTKKDNALLGYGYWGNRRGRGYCGW